jgi:hypothetical protein
LVGLGSGRRAPGSREAVLPDHDRALVPSPGAPDERGRDPTDLRGAAGLPGLGLVTEFSGLQRQRRPEAPPAQEGASRRRREKRRHVQGGVRDAGPRRRRRRP